jgi:mRNA interferase HicA
MTWAELIRVLRDHGFQELRTGRGSHRQFWNPTTKRIVTIAVHTRKDVGKGLASRILKDAGIKESKDGQG